VGASGSGERLIVTMASVVFMRGVNVGGHKTFRPASVARDLAALDVVNVGAAGTYVVRKVIRPIALRAELGKKLPFEADLMICSAREVLDLIAQEPFSSVRAGTDMRRFVTVMARHPQPIPRLPVDKPSGEEWQVRVIAVYGSFALSLWRRLGRSIVYPNEVVEKTFGVAATTRSWNTILKIRDLLEA
jgi:uncharacterized protein (DUF1697 family)